jgi:hypothetical protein
MVGAEELGLSLVLAARKTLPSPSLPRWGWECVRVYDEVFKRSVVDAQLRSNQISLESLQGTPHLKREG